VTQDVAIDRGPVAVTHPQVPSTLQAVKRGCCDIGHIGDQGSPPACLSFCNRPPPPFSKFAG
jgi:hypothetical protein